MKQIKSNIFCTKKSFSLCGVVCITETKCRAFVCCGEKNEDFLATRKYAKIGKHFLVDVLRF